ncbi:DUF2142 domain-containing protein [Phormidesmis priestleyi]|uniref:DUF2142 domain-containing protein n=1 Tax=Phormidesmis priestleyi TaxID=268141 RepID=UPI0018D278E4|nr:DUF2142 domain-containing protein [Phormidesmis priestleyi]
MKKNRDFSSLNELFKGSEGAFLTLSLIFGLMFLIVLPPLQAPDEHAHFFRAYQLTDGKIIADVLTEKKDREERATYLGGGALPSSVIRTATVWAGRIPGHSSEKVKNEQFLETWAMPLEAEKTTRDVFNSAPYSPIPYIPQMIGIAFGKLFNLPPLWLTYLGRFANLVIATLITFVSIKVLPIYKWVFFLLALTPMALSQRASLSADAVLNGVSFLLIATIINCAFNSKKVKVLAKDVALISLGGILVSLSKIVYLPFVLLFFLIPRHKFDTRKNYWLSFLFLILSNVSICFLWNLSVKHLGVPVSRITGASIEGQVEYLYSHPLMVFSIAWNTLQNIRFILDSFIGILGSLDTPIPTITVLSYQVILVLVALVSNQAGIVISLSSKLTILFVLGATVTLIHLLMYLVWTTVGGTDVLGVQGRYFIPTSPLFFLLLYNQRFSFDISEKSFQRLIIYYSVFALLSSLIAMIARYY